LLFQATLLSGLGIFLPTLFQRSKNMTKVKSMQHKLRFGLTDIQAQKT